MVLVNIFRTVDYQSVMKMSFMTKGLDNIIQSLPVISQSCLEPVASFLFQRVRQVSYNSQTNHLSVEISILSHMQSDSITKTELMKRKYRELMECQAVRSWEKVCSVVSSDYWSGYLDLMNEMMNKVISSKLIIMIE